MTLWPLTLFLFCVSCTLRKHGLDPITLGLTRESHYKAGAVTGSFFFSSFGWFQFLEAELFPIWIMRRTGNDWRKIIWGLINDTNWYKSTSWNYDFKNQNRTALASRGWGRNWLGKGMRGLTGMIVMFCISRINVVYNFSEKFMSGGYKQYITLYALYIILVC